MQYKDEQLLPDGAYANLDLVYDIKTYGDVRHALRTKTFQGLKLSVKDIKHIKETMKKYHLEEQI
jgi:hypothetical protein